MDFAENPEVYNYIPQDRLSRYEVFAFHHTYMETALSLACIKEENGIGIENEIYNSMLIRMERKLKNNKILDRSFTMTDLLKTLNNRGICMEQIGIQTYITNSKYPNLFSAAALLEETASAYYQRTKRSPQQYRLLDFLSLGNDKRKFTLEDITAPMYDDEKELLYRFIGELRKKIRLSQSCRIWYFRAADFVIGENRCSISGGENLMHSRSVSLCPHRILPLMHIFSVRSTNSRTPMLSRRFVMTI